MHDAPCAIDMLVSIETFGYTTYPVWFLLQKNNILGIAVDLELYYA
jgi:hypothetical protein